MRLSECPVRAAIDVIDGKWKPIIVNALKPGTLRFGQLRRHAPEATRKVLTEQLRELEKDQIITRKVRAEMGASGICAHPLRADSRTGSDTNGKVGQEA